MSSAARTGNHSATPATTPPGWWTPPPQGKWTQADYLRLPENELRYELIEGNLIMTPAPSIPHQDAVGNLYFALRRHLEQAGPGTPRGRVFMAPCAVFLNQEDSVQPDVVYVAPAHLEIVKQARIEGAPDLVAEVLSPGNQVYDRQRKLRLYMDAGVRECWIVDPAERQIEVFVRREGQARYVQVGAFKPGMRVHSEAAQGFSVPVEEICTS